MEKCVLLMRFSFKWVWVKQRVGGSLRTALTSCFWYSLHNFVSRNLCRQTSNMICYKGPFFHFSGFINIFMLRVIITRPHEKLNRTFLLLLNTSFLYVFSFSSLLFTAFMDFVLFLLFFLLWPSHHFVHPSFFLSSWSAQPLIRGE